MTAFVRLADDEPDDERPAAAPSPALLLAPAPAPRPVNLESRPALGFLGGPAAACAASSASKNTDCMSEPPAILELAVFQPDAMDQAACRVSGNGLPRDAQAYQRSAVDPACLGTTSLALAVQWLGLLHLVVPRTADQTPS